MARFALVTLAVCLVSCGGNTFSSFEGTGGGDGSDASSPAGSGGSGGSSGGAAVGGGAGTGGSIGTGGTSGTGGATGSGGASGTGGSAGHVGTGGNAGSAMDAGTPPPVDSGTGPSCKVDTDCKLIDNCCACEAVSGNVNVPVCNIACIQSACAARQIHGVRCSEGKCVAAPDCDGSKVTCKLLPPVCPLGQVLSVKGMCWGECVPATTCRTVTDCKACESDGHFCASQETQLGPIYRCVDTPAACGGGNVTCGCAGSSACLPPFGTCNASMGGRQLNCSCPTC